MKNSFDINLTWSIPEGPIPARCFIYEILFTEAGRSWMVGILHLFGEIINTAFNKKFENQNQIIHKEQNIHVS